MCDGQMWIYSPTPLLIETGAQRSDQPNALLLTEITALTAVAQACAADGAGGEETPPPSQAEIGRLAATPQAIANSLEDLLEITDKLTSHSQRALPAKPVLSRAITLITAVND